MQRSRYIKSRGFSKNQTFDLEKKSCKDNIIQPMIKSWERKMYRTINQKPKFKTQLEFQQLFFPILSTLLYLLLLLEM